MNYWILTLTFISVNLDFFLMLLFLLRKYRTGAVIAGYVLGTISLLLLSYIVGATLTRFLPEWLLGVLGLLPIYMALHQDNNTQRDSKVGNPVLAVMLTYLSVCSGCNLAIFLPVLVGSSVLDLGLTILFISILSALAVLLVRAIGHIPAVSSVMNHFGERLMRICYFAIGLYVFWDSGLITHMLNLI